MSETQAVRLTSRIRHARSNYEVAAVYVGPFDRICHGLEGLPLRNYRLGEHIQFYQFEHVVRFQCISVPSMNRLRKVFE